MRPSFHRALLTCCLVLASASIVDAAALTLAWDPPTDDLTAGYVLAYGTKSGVYTSRVDVGFVTTRKIDGLASGTRYYFRVQAYSEDGTLSDYSAEVSGMTALATSGGGGTTTGGSTGGSTSGGGSTGGGTPAVSAPATAPSVTSVVAFMRSGRYIDITWTPLSSDGGYRVEVGGAAGQTSYSAVTASTAITFDSTDMPSPAYYIRVRGITGGVPGAPSNEETVAGTSIPRLDTSTNAAGACGDAPGAPRQFSTGATGTAVRLAWAAGSGSMASSYVLQVGSAPGLQNLMIVPLPGSERGLSATANFGIYALRLVASNDCGPSTWGAESILNVGGVSAAPATGGPAPGAPQALAQAVDGTLVTLTWNAPTGASPTRYLIEATIPDGTLVASLDTGNPATAFSHPNTPAGTYIVTVRAGNGSGFGPPSSPVTVVVP
jgi:hypothetical protein